MKETIDTIMKWHKETFPDATLEGQLEKYQEEQQEWVKLGEKGLTELADMFIVACGIARFELWEGLFYMHDVYEWYLECQGAITFADLKEAVEEKMTKNRKRVWNKTAVGSYHHENGIED